MIQWYTKGIFMQRYINIINKKKNTKKESSNDKYDDQNEMKCCTTFNDVILQYCSNINKYKANTDMNPNYNTIWICICEK